MLPLWRATCVAGVVAMVEMVEVVEMVGLLGGAVSGLAGARLHVDGRPLDLDVAARCHRRRHCSVLRGAARMVRSNATLPRQYHCHHHDHRRKHDSPPKGG